MIKTKFRAWDKENKKMYEVTVIDFEAESVQVLHFDNWNSKDPNTGSPVQCSFMKKYGKHLAFDDLDLMQFTGLHDKNGKEIYEGDIVCYQVPEKVSNNKLNLNKSITKEKVVKWSDFSCGFNVTNTDKPIYEVIGNIHENPALLGEQNEA